MAIVKSTVEKILDKCVLSICAGIYQRKLEYANGFLKAHRETFRR